MTEEIENLSRPMTIEEIKKIVKHPSLKTARHR